MRFAVVALAACGCNQVFGLEQTIGPSVYFDAPVDAPFACPPVGQTPQFSRLLHQIPQRCSELSASLIADQAIAMCFEPTMQIAQGTAVGPLEQIAGFETVNRIHYDAPRLMPDGDQVIIRRWDEGTVVGEIRVYNRGADGVLTYSHEITLPSGAQTDSFVRYGSPSRGPSRRMFYRPNIGPLTELEFGPSGASTIAATYTEDDFGVTSFAGLPPSITGDGLRLVMYAGGPEGNGIYYSDRAMVTDRFRTASLLMNVPPAIDAFMTDDCERLYFSAINSLFWVQQQ